MTRLTEIMAAGTWRASSGDTFTYSESDLDDIASGYSPDLKPAPLFLHHDETKENVGIVHSVFRVGKKLLANFRNLDPAFKAGQKKDKYPAISPALFHPSDPNNPTPGKWYLRHVAPVQVGAMTLAPPQYGDDGPPLYLCSFEAEKAEPIEPLEEGKEELVEPEQAETTIPEIPMKTAPAAPQETGAAFLDSDGATELQTGKLVDALTSAFESIKPPVASASVEHSAPVEDPSIAELRQQLAAEKAAIDVQKASLKQQVAELEQRKAKLERHSEDAQFADSLAKAGKLTHAKYDMVMALLQEAPIGSPCFADGDDQKDYRSTLKAFLEDLPTVVETAEFAAATDAVEAVEASDLTYEQITQGALKIQAEFSAVGKSITLGDAIVQFGKQRGLN